MKVRRVALIAFCGLTLLVGGCSTGYDEGPLEDAILVLTRSVRRCYSALQASAHHAGANINESIKILV